MCNKYMYDMKADACVTYVNTYDSHMWDMYMHIIYIFWKDI